MTKLVEIKNLKTLDFWIDLLLITTIFFTPVYFAAFYKTASPFTISKITVFQILIEITAALFLIKIIKEKKISCYINKKYLLIVLPFFLALVISTLFSSDPALSFWGSYWRKLGLYGHLHYFLFFILLITNIDSKKKVEKLISASLLGSVVVCAYGILQWAGLDTLSWWKPLAVRPRITSTIGQPLLLGNYLLFTIFLAGYRVTISKKIIKKFSYSILLFINLFCLFATYSRSSWLGLSAGIAIGVFIYLFIKNKKYLKFFIVFIVIAIFFVSISVFANFSSIKGVTTREDISLESRIKSVFDYTSGSAAMRVLYWQAGLSSFSEKPIFGYGPDNIRDALFSGFGPNWLLHEALNTYPDRTHNEYLDLALFGGLLALSSFLYIIIFVFIKCFKYLGVDNQNKKFVFFLILSIFSYLFSLLFSFSTIETNVYFWLFIALLFLVFNNFNNSSSIILEKSKISYLFLSLPFFVLLIYFIVVNFNNARADYYFFQAKNGKVNGNISKMLKYNSMAASISVGEDYYRNSFIFDLKDTTNGINSIEYRKAVIDYLKILSETQHVARDNSQSLLGEANVYIVLGKFEDEKYYSEAEKTFNKIININPNVSYVYSMLGDMYYDKNDSSKALANYQKSLTFLPELSDKNFAFEHRENMKIFESKIYEKIGSCYYNESDYENALVNYEKSISLQPFQMGVLKRISDIYFLKDKYQEALSYVERGYARNPHDAVWSFSMAMIYDKLNEEEKAKEYVAEALSLSPENKQMQEFAESLK
ncbi:MAG: O-antigen ligase family protein [bacterium]